MGGSVTVWTSAVHHTQTMNGRVVLVVAVYFGGKSLGCARIKYIPPRTEPEFLIQTEEPDCSDCSRGHARFFFETDRRSCCTETPRADKERLKNATDCGRKGGTAPYLNLNLDEDEKIIGGIPARENEFPWQVGVMTTNDTWRGCGAILLSCDPVIVVSAAHCLTSQLFSDLNEIKLSFGAQNMGMMGTNVENIEIMDTNEVRLEVEEVIIHPSYRPITIHAGINFRTNLNLNVNVYENDIAVVKVKNGETLKCSKRTIWPACLPNKDFEYGGWNRSILTGWGRIKDGESTSMALRKARIPIVTDEECLRNILQDSPDFPEEQIDIVALADSKLCAGDIEAGIGICEGDSGGPLVAQDDQDDEWKGWSAVGIASYRPIPQEGYEGCGGNRYGVFTEVGKYLDWIASNFDMLPPTDSV